MPAHKRNSLGGAGGMDEALRYQQHLQFCQQLHSLQQQLCEATAQSEELLGSLYAMGKYAATPSCCLSHLAVTYPEFAAKLQRSVKPHPLRELHVEQMEGEAVEAVMSGADHLAAMLQPMYRELQELGKFMVRASSLLADLHQLLIPVTMATAPQLIESFMLLFTNTTRIVLLMDRVPWKLLVQVYTIVTSALDNSAPPGRTAVCELLVRLGDPVSYLQELFQPISSRVSQVLELAVNAVLDHVATARVLEASSVFDVSRLGELQLGVTGLSLQRTYSFMQRLDDFRSWALLGFLACPAALQGVNAQPLLAALLRDGFLLPVFGDVCLPLHATFQQHVAPALEQLVSVLLGEGGGGRAGGRAQQAAEARQLVGRCYAAAAEGAEAEHAARRRFICRVLQDMLACLEDDASRLPEALPMALAAQAYARSELLWYFRHVGERLPPPPQQQAGPAAGAAGAAVAAAGKLALPLLGGAPPQPQLAQDGHVARLIAATAAVYELLEEHQAVLQGHQLATMRALLEQQVLPETAAVLATADRNAQEVPAAGKDRVVPRILVPLLKAVVFPLAELSGAECAASAPTAASAGAAGAGAAGASVAASAAAAVAAAVSSAAGGEPCAPASPRSCGPPPGSDPVAVLAAAQRSMVHLTMLLSSRNLWMRPAVLEAPAQDPQYLEAIHKLLELTPFATFFAGALGRACCLAQLAFYQDKLAALQAHVLGGCTLAAREDLAACPCLLKVLHWFEHNPPVPSPDGEGSRDYGAEANALAAALLEEQGGTVALFLSEMAQELRSGLFVTHAPAGATQAPAPDGGAVAAASAASGGEAPASVRSRALALAHAMDRAGPVRVSGTRLVVPVEFLRAALQQCLLLEVNDMVEASEVPPVPSQLARALRDLLWATAELHEVLSIDVHPELWQVLLNHAQPDWVLPPPAPAPPASGARGPADWGWPAPPPLQPPPPSCSEQPAGGGEAPPGAPEDAAPSAAGAGAGACGAAGVPFEVQSIVASYGRWYVRHVVRDARGRGVLFAPQLRRFTAVTGQVEAIHARASLQELTALLQVFGPYAALKLAEATEGVVLDCLSQLDGCLLRWKEQLDPVTMAVVRDDSCSDAVAAACAALTDEGQVLTQARQLSRCLAFRQLLSEALAQALSATFPAAAATVEAVAGNAALDVNAGAAAPPPAPAAGGAPGTPCGGGGGAGGASCSELVAGRHLADLFELPRPGLGGVGSPVVADPVVVNTLVGSNNYERYRAWFNLPALLGLCLNSPTITPSTLVLSEHSMANELHALAHAAKCLVLAQQQAADRVLVCGSRFLHPEAEDQAGDMLATFAKVAAMTCYLRNDAVGVRTCKQLLMESLACPQLPASRLCDAWLPPTRMRSGLCQAGLG